MFSFQTCEYPLLILSLQTGDPMTLDRWVQEQLSAHPQLTSRPWAVDVTHCQGHVDMGEIIRVCRKYGATLGGVMGAGGGTLGQANSMGLALLPPAAAEPLQLSVQTVTPEPEPVAVSMPQPSLGAQIVRTPIRSGQQVWAQGRDLIAMGQISQSAEVMADGNLLCYGPAKGRLAAGVSGNTEAIICVNKLQAELVAIAGVFLTLDDLQNHDCWGQPCQISLQGQHLILAPLG